MADVRTFEYKGKNVQVTVNKNGAHYLGEIEIEGMKLSGQQKFGPEEPSEGAAFRSCQRKAEELIDGAPTV
jgi:hypothetical protein